jgi:hypothetical protein
VNVEAADDVYPGTRGSNEIRKHSAKEVDKLACTLTVELQGLARLSGYLAGIGSGGIELEEPTPVNLELLPDAFHARWMRRTSRIIRSPK